MITTSQSAGKLIEIFATRSILTSVSRLLFNNVLQGNPWGKKNPLFLVHILVLVFENDFRTCETKLSLECNDENLRICLNVPVTNVTKFYRAETSSECSSTRVQECNVVQKVTCQPRTLSQCLSIPRRECTTVERTETRLACDTVNMEGGIVLEFKCSRFLEHKW